MPNHVISAFEEYLDARAMNEKRAEKMGAKPN